MKDINVWTEKIYMRLYKKYIKSKSFFIILNIISFTLVASMIILNIYAIKKNPFPNTVIYYVIIAISTGLMGLISGIISFFTLNKNSNKYKGQYEEILQEYNEYKIKAGVYDSSNRNEILIDRVQNIVSD